MSCAFRACARSTYLHSVCMDHLIVTLEAGRRASQHAPDRRLARLVAEMNSTPKEFQP